MGSQDSRETPPSRMCNNSSFNTSITSVFSSEIIECSYKKMGCNTVVNMPTSQLFQSLLQESHQECFPKIIKWSVWTLNILPLCWSQVNIGWKGLVHQSLIEIYTEIWTVFESGFVSVSYFHIHVVVSLDFILPHSVLQKFRLSAGIRFNQWIASQILRACLFNRRKTLQCIIGHKSSDI